MVRYCSLVFIFVILLLTPPRGQGVKEQVAYNHLYQQAEKFFTSPDATEHTDSAALSLYLQAASLLEKDRSNKPLLLNCYLKSGILKMSAGDQPSALSLFQQAIFVGLSGSEMPDSLLFKPFLYAGGVHYTLNNLDSARIYFSKAEAIVDAHPGLDESERLFNKLGALYYETGDYKKCVQYTEKALSVVESKKNPNTFFIVNYKNNIATALLKLQEYNKALTIYNSILSYHIAQDELFYNMGNAYIGEGEYDTALHFLKQIKAMNHEKFNSLARVFLLQKKYDSAGLFIARAADVYLADKINAQKINYGVTLTYSGNVKAAIGKLPEAVSDYQLAIQYLNPAFREKNIADNPTSFTGLQNFSLLFDAIVSKATALKMLEQQQPGQQYLHYSLNAYTSAIALARHIERIYFSDDARLFLKNKVNPATQQAVTVALELFNKTADKKYLHTAFEFAENNKASVLQAGLQQTELANIPGLPVDLIQQEKKYKSIIAKLTIQASQAKDSMALQSIEKQSKETEFNLALLQEKLDQDPVYHQLKFNHVSVNTDSLQQTLVKSDEAILSYYYTSDSLLCFYITNKQVGYKSTPLKNDFFLSVISLRQQLETPASSSRKLLQQTGAALYTELISFVIDKIKDKRHLLIIPYNEISYVPFEMLYNLGENSFLLNKFAITYNYTASLLSDKSKTYPASYQVLAMAPFSEKNNTAMTLPPLPFSGEEVDGLPGKKVTGSAATKSQFTAYAQAFPVVHLATHAVANDTNALGSYIEFYGVKNAADTGSRLYESEIYNLDMKAAKLVILSACETGSGQMVNGEGVISLSRAFSYAGCKSVITSLWKADDLATSFIIKRLHYYLQKGDTKDIALQNAKLDYINNSEIDSRFKTPAYWAHLVLIGDQQALVDKGINWYYIVTIFAALFVAVILIIKKTGQK